LSTIHFNVWRHIAFDFGINPLLLLIAKGM